MDLGDLIMERDKLIEKLKANFKYFKMMLWRTGHSVT